jgi:hypothetical protein
MMQVPAKLVTGALGESMAQVVFQLIGWAPPAKIAQDIGDDLITFARDKAVSDQPDLTYDLSAPVLVQVKSSPTEYLQPKNTTKGRKGWWFAESDTDHFDHWLKFGLPYLLVLLDTKNQIAYWTYVHNENIVTTGKGRKIFVPWDQRVDENSLEALNAIATAHRTNSLEGSAWTGTFTNLSPNERLRNALIMPRLVAPHPNRPPALIAYEQAVAILLRNRGSELEYLAKKGFCPPPDKWAEHKHWGWRFVAAIRDVLTAGSSSALDTLSSDAKLAFERDACNVVRACVAYTGGRTADAADMLKIYADTKPVDRGWLLAHRACLLLELDQPEAAAGAAQDALFALKALDGDLSVSAVRGGCASILYSVAGYGVGDLEQTVAAQDNAGSWWRSQDVSHALDRDLTARFNAWAGDKSLRFGASNASSELNTAAWNAAFSATWGSWRHLSLQIAQVVFTSTNASDAVGESLNLLVFTGNTSETKMAASHLWVNGPLASLQTVVTNLAQTPWSKRAEGPVMAVFAEAADLLSMPLADRAAGRILDVLKEDGSIRQLGGGWANRWNEIDDALSRLLSVASTETHTACAELVCSNFQGPEGRAASLVRIAAHITLLDLDAEVLSRLYDAAKSREDHYCLDLLEVLGQHHPPAVLTLRELAKAGSAAASRGLLVTGSRERQDWAALGKAAGATVNEMLADAAGIDGTFKYSGYVYDQLLDLTQAAFHTGNNQLWKQVTDALATGTLLTSQVYRSIELLAGRFAELPAHVQRRLKRTAPTIVAVPDVFGTSDNFSSAVTGLMVAAGIPSDVEVLTTLLQLRRTDPVSFVRLLSLWSSPHNRSFLTSASVDPDPYVRSQAGYSLVEFSSKNSEHAAEIATILDTALVLSDGCRMHGAVAQALKEFPQPEFATIESKLAAHPSALVRRHLTESDDS